MKKTICLMILFAAAFTSFSQLRKVPSEVTNAMKEKYPDAQNVEWKDKLTFFEASFTLDGTEMTADFSNKGEWQETDKKMDFNDLPAAVKDGFQKSKFADWTPGSVSKIEKNDKSIQYKVYAEKSSIIQKKFLYFNQEGQLIKDTPGI